MSQPSVEVTELDGALGVLPSGVNALAIIGTSSIGTVASPVALARTADVASGFGAGQLVEGASYWIRNYGRPALCCKATSATPGSSSVVTHSGAGTSVVTVSVGTALDEFEVRLRFATGGTIGVAGITFYYSLDGGRNEIGPISLGIANTYVVPDSGTTVAFAAGTVLAAQTESYTTTAPAFDSAGVAAAIAALKASSIPWDLVMIVGPVDATIIDAIETAFGSIPEKAYLCGFRKPTAAETEATYKTAFDTAFGAKATTKGGVCAGGAEITSGVSFRKYWRPIVMAAAARIAFRDDEEDAAEIDHGALPGVSIRDSAGNPKHHDESVNPGLDASRAITLRTWDDTQGVYINNPRLLSAAGSDFEFVQHRRVMNVAKRALRLYFQRRLSKKILVDRRTGFILENEAKEIESGANAVLRAVLLTKPKASSATVSVSRTDLILSTKTLSVTAVIVPLAYPKTISLTIGFRNPALTVTAV